MIASPSALARHCICRAAVASGDTSRVVLAHALVPVTPPAL